MASSLQLDDARIALDAVARAGNRVRHAGQDVPALRLALKADHDAGLLPKVFDAYDVLPVEGLERATLTVAWPAQSRFAAVAAFVRTIQQIAREAAPYDNPFLPIQPA